MKFVIIVPTGVGVNRIATPHSGSSSHCPHGRGGEPSCRSSRSFFPVLSPRAWG